MDPSPPGHSLDMMVQLPTLGEATPLPGRVDDGAQRPQSARGVVPAERLGEPPARALSFDEVYEEHADFVWRSLRSLGVREHAVEDAMQDVFVVVHRRLAEFEHRSTVRSWVFGIALRVARDHRRRHARKGGLDELDFEVADHAPGPAERAAQTEALREVAQVLEALDADKRAVFVLAEIEQWTAPEIAEALGVNLNTVYSRIRAARREFEAELRRRREERA